MTASTILVTTDVEEMDLSSIVKPILKCKSAPLVFKWEFGDALETIFYAIRISDS